MANHKSAVKQHRQSVERRDRNRHNRSRLRSRVKLFQKAIESGELDAARQMLPETLSLVDRSAKLQYVGMEQPISRVACGSLGFVIVANALNSSEYDGGSALQVDDCVLDGGERHTRRQGGHPATAAHCSPPLLNTLLWA